MVTARVLFNVINPFPALLYCGIVTVGSGVPPQAALGAPGTNVKVGTEPKGDRELPPSRWCRELTVIHTN